MLWLTCIKSIFSLNGITSIILFWISELELFVKSKEFALRLVNHTIFYSLLYSSTSILTFRRTIEPELQRSTLLSKIIRILKTDVFFQKDEIIGDGHFNAPGIVCHCDEIDPGFLKPVPGTHIYISNVIADQVFEFELIDFNSLHHSAHKHIYSL